MIKAILSFVLFALLVVPTRPAQDTTQPALKEIFKNDFLIGAALNRRQFSEEDLRAAPIIKTHFNSITAENQLKWQYIHPRPDAYDFAGADRFVQFGEKHQMFIVGHTLLWHRQTPAWVFQDARGNRLDRDALLQRMRDHIHTIVGRYKGRIKGWDVVNEALNEDGSMRQSQWMQIIGNDYVAKAFQFAREADPQAELYYNDYSLENEPKRNGAVRLIKELQSQGIPVAGVGLQGHNNLEWPSVEQQEATIKAFASLGIKIHITELDLDVLPRVPEDIGRGIATTDPRFAKLNPYTSGIPASVTKAQAERYRELFGVYLKHRDVIDRVTFWGVTDGDTWLNNWPVRGRTNYPLLFDREGKAKPAFSTIVQTRLSSAR